MPSNAERTCCAEIVDIQHRGNLQVHSLVLGCISENMSKFSIDFEHIQLYSSVFV